MWDAKHKNINSTENKRIEFEYKYLGNKTIEKIKPSCSCFKPVLKGNTIQVSYLTGKIPFHLSSQGWMIDSKHINVTFDDGDIDRVYFKITVKKH